MYLCVVKLSEELVVNVLEVVLCRCVVVCWCTVSEELVVKVLFFRCDLCVGVQV